MLDGEFNNILRWRYAELPRVIGSGLGIKANTEREMAAALEKAHANDSSWSIIQVMLDRHDCSPALKRLTSKLGERVR